MNIRLLKKEDYFDSILEILNQLSHANLQTTFEEFAEWLENLPSNHYIFVVIVNDKVAGLGTLLLEHKIIHSFGKVGHIEDVVVLKEYRGKGIGKFLIKHLLHVAEKDFNVYKVILNCSESNIPFYENCGLVHHQHQMVKYFKD